MKSDSTITTMIQQLKQLAIQNNVGLWKRVAEDLEAPTRQRRIVNVCTLNEHTKDDEIVVVPGKVLANGMLDHKVTVAAWAFSGAAKQKIVQARGNCLSISELVQQHPKGKNVRIIG
ncbi:MAG TPA: 50S ribosomal protein L18e [Candidatus Nanoarchaeia archaeon]|nr:50S ribosomal protein L18e [Candidatus Nanoarchaeia archaeon]